MASNDLIRSGRGIGAVPARSWTEGWVAVNAVASNIEVVSFSPRITAQKRPESREPRSEGWRRFAAGARPAPGPTPPMRARSRSIRVAPGTVRDAGASRPASGPEDAGASLPGARGGGRIRSAPHRRTRDKAPRRPLLRQESRRRAWFQDSRPTRHAQASCARSRGSLGVRTPKAGIESAARNRNRFR
jgi:hypothetical protein